MKAKIIQQITLVTQEPVSEEFRAGLNNGLASICRNESREGAIDAITNSMSVCGINVHYTNGLNFVLNTVIAYQEF